MTLVLVDCTLVCFFADYLGNQKAGCRPRFHLPVPHAIVTDRFTNSGA